MKVVLVCDVKHLKSVKLFGNHFIRVRYFILYQGSEQRATNIVQSKLHFSLSSQRRIASFSLLLLLFRYSLLNLYKDTLT